MTTPDKTSIEVKSILCSRRMFQENSYLVWCRQSLEALLIDPGCVDATELNDILGCIRSGGLTLKWIVNTHGHLDHIAGNAAVQSATGAEILVHGDDAALLTDPRLNGSIMMGISVVSPRAARTLADGELLQLGSHEFRVVHTPGHTRGGITLVGAGYAFTGDTLFAGGVGRTDLPGGSMEALLASIREKLFTLEEKTVVLSGHGPKTTIGVEKKTNPFL
jgi:hydroxyacylglutathione hydrolase